MGTSKQVLCILNNFLWTESICWRKMTWYTISWLSLSILGWLLLLSISDFDQMKTFSFSNLFSNIPANFHKRPSRIRGSTVSEDDRTFWQTPVSWRPCLLWSRALDDVTTAGARSPGTAWVLGPRVYPEAWALLDTFTQAKHITLSFRLFLLAAGDDIYSEIIFCLIRFFCSPSWVLS